MKKFRDLPSVCDMLEYVSGVLIWKDRPESDFRTQRGHRVFQSRFAGKRAGTSHPEGYRQIVISGVVYFEHRVVWTIHNGPIPDGLDIDHINGKRDDNRIENLRLATRGQNLWNNETSKGVCSLRGVSFDKRRKKKPYYSRIRVNYKVYNLGSFATEQEAHEAFLRAEKDLHGQWARQSSDPQQLTLSLRNN